MATIQFFDGNILTKRGKINKMNLHNKRIKMRREKLDDSQLTVN